MKEKIKLTYFKILLNKCAKRKTELWATMQVVHLDPNTILWPVNQDISHPRWSGSTLRLHICADKVYWELL